MQPSPRVFHYSLDWRFLLPTTDLRNIGLLLEDDQDFRETLGQVGIQAAQQLSLSELKHKNRNEMQSFVMPFGLPTGWVGPKQEDQVEFYASLHRSLALEGYLLVGFNNAWNLPTGSRAKYYSSTPRRMSAQLRQAGFQAVEVFGVMQDLAIPEYIFNLESRSLQFALQNRFRRKPRILRVLRVLAKTIGVARLANFLPCYFALASG